MKRILFFITVMMCFLMTGQEITTTDFWQKDKIKHSIGTFGISAVTYTYLSIHKKHKKLPEVYKRLISLSTAMAIGGLKEAIDSTSSNRYASWGDMGANAVGVLAFQATISIPLHLKPKRKRNRDISFLVHDKN